MDISLIFKVAGLGIITMVADIILDTAGKGNWKTYLNMIAVILVISLVIGEISSLFSTVRTMFQL